jgi:vacuolar protein sorting-associated protein IST1
VCAIVYAAPRTELKELHVLREILMHKFGRNFSLALQLQDPPPAEVPPRILSKLATYTPPAELVDAYLSEIARGYGVAYAPLGKEDIPPLDDDEGSGGEGTKEEGKKEEGLKAEGGADRTPSPSTAEKAPAPRGPVVVKKATPEDELAARFERLKSVR